MEMGMEKEVVMLKLKEVVGYWLIKMGKNQEQVPHF